MDTTRPTGLQKTGHFEILHPAELTHAFATSGPVKMLLWISVFLLFRKRLTPTMIVQDFMSGPQMACTGLGLQFVA